MCTALKFVRRSLFVALACASLLFAQSDTGSLSGRIDDPSGASVGGATLVLTNDGTGQARTTTANAAGYYEYPSVPVGQYSLEIQQTGFKRIRRTGITISIARRATVDIVLEIGDSKQTVDVSAQAPLIDQQTSDIGTNFQPKFMKDAPLFVTGGFRNPENFVSYVPGVNGGPQETSVSGGARRSKEILIDGASHTNPESGGVAFAANGGIGSVEMYNEFRILTNNFTAEYGRSGGGVEIFVSKSGTNDLHGTVFDFLRNDKFDAAGWSVNQRTPFTGKPKVRQNEYGVAVGGPVVIPKLYNGRNRTFWYFTWNGYRQNNGGATSIASVPTVNMKNGRFTDAGLRAIYDPATIRTVNGQLVRDPFAGNVIPTNRFSSVSRNVLPLIPDPTSANITNNYGTTSDATVERNIYSIKLDHSFTERNRISGLYSWQRQTTFTQSGLPGALASGLVQNQKPDITRVNHDYIFTPTVFNHATFGLSRYQDLFNQLPQQLDNWPSKLGLTGVATNGSTSFPIVTFTDALTGFGNNPKTRGAQQNWTYEFLDNLTFIQNRHEFKLGYEFHRGRTFQVPLDDSYAQGLFNFNSLQTANPAARSTTGNSFASFLLGAIDSGRRDYNTKGVNNLYVYNALYFQDNYKVTSRLTLNLGVRWEIFVPRTDTNLTLSTFDPTVPNPGANGRYGALAFAGTGPGRTGLPRFGGIYGGNFGPRIGGAYQINSKTVLRAGYGLYFSPANGNTGGGCFPCGWGTSASLSPTSDGINPAFNWDNGFPVPAGFQFPPVIDPSYANFANVLSLTRKDGLPAKIQNWQVNLQRQLPGSVLLDLAYVGSYGDNLESYRALNQLDPKYLSLGSTLGLQVRDPRVAALGFQVPFASFPSGTNGTLAQSLRPYPQYLNITQIYSGGGSTTFNALQAKVEKRYSALTMLIAYNWQKNMAINGAYTNAGNGIAPQDQYNLTPEKWISPQDVPHTLSLVYTWDLPLGKGRRFVNSSNGFVNALVSGWTIAGLQQYTAGLPLLINSPVNTLGNGVLFTPQLRANITGQPIRTNVDRTALDPNNPNAVYFNRAAFATPGAYQFGNASPFLTNLRNLPVFSESLSLVKRTTIKERANIEYRADISNLFNRTSFGFQVPSVTSASPSLNLSSPNFGRPGGVLQNPRIIQMALRFNF